MATAYEVYWTAYGGWYALRKSYYLHGSWIFAAAAFPAWLKKAEDGSYSWMDTALSVTPSMLGFSLGAMAILLAIGPGTFLKVAQSGGNQSFFMKAIAAFFHFMLVQIVCILFTIFAQAWPSGLFSFLGFALFIYAIACSLAAAAAVVDLAEVKVKADGFD